MQYKAVLLADASKHDHVKGTLSAGMIVNVGDWYVYGDLYECIQAHTAGAGNYPPNTNYWTLVVSNSVAGIWTIRTSPADNNWFSVCYGNGLFVAVAYSGTGNRVMTSPDGITWTIRTSSADNSWYSVCYGNGLFVAVAYSGTGNRVMTSGIINTPVADDNFNTLPEKTAFVDADPALIYSVADAAYRKMQLGNLKKMVVCWVGGDSSTAQTLTTGVQTKIAAGYAASASIDTLAGWDGTNKKYVCKEAGFYLIWAQTTYAANGTGLRYIAVYYNNAWAEIVNTGASAAGNWQQVQGWMGLALNVNDTVEIGVEQTSGGNLNIQWGNRFLIIKVA